MKKFLSLVLALVMTMSLVTISAGAKDFTDDDKITYEEAVAVVSEIGVVDGYADGKFNPTNTLTRQAAAKIICNLILGPTTAAELHADTAPYKDVPATSEFAGYIAYCAKESIISGYADGTFKPGNTLTGYAFMKMLLGALGYDAEVEGYTGANWSINVAKRALGIGLNKGLKTEFNGIKAVTREEACLYAFNTLKADLVEYDAKTNISVGGAEVIIAGSEAKAQKWGNSATRIENIKKDSYIQFAEQYFNKLTRADGEDAFGRPTNEWTYNKKDVGSFVNYDLFVTSYTAKVEGGDVYSDIGSAAADYALTYWQDGVKMGKDAVKTQAGYIEKKNDDTMGASGNGVLTEVYVDNDNETLTIVEINTYLAKVSTDYSEKNETLKIAVYNKVDGTTTNKTVYLDDVANLADFEKDDLVLVTIADGTVMSMADPEVVADTTVTTYSTNDGSTTSSGTLLKKLTADGTKYDAAVKAFYDIGTLTNYKPEQLDDNTFNIYLDPYGYIIGIEMVDADEEYLFVVGAKMGTEILANAINQANVIFTDGTMKTVEFKLAKNMSATDKAIFERDNKAVNTWFEYTMDDDVYVLESKADQVKDYSTKDIDDEHNTVADKDAPNKVKFGNSKSVFITVDLNDDKTRIDDVDTVTTGIKNTDIEVTLPGNDTIGGTFAMYNSKGYITYAVVVGEDANSSDNLVYITSDVIVDKTYVSKEVGYVYTYDAIVNGKATTVQVKKDAVGISTLAENTLFKFTYDKDGYAKKVEILDTNNTPWTTTQYKKDGYMVAKSNTSGTYAAWTVTLDGATLWLNDNTTNQKYIILDDECNFFVKVKDSSNKKYNTDGYEEFADADAALATLGSKQYTGKLVAVCDKDTGYATTVIFYDTVYNDGIDTTVTPGTPKAVTYVIKMVNPTTGEATGVEYKKDGTPAIGVEKTVTLSEVAVFIGIETDNLTAYGASSVTFTPVVEGNVVTLYAYYKA